MARRSLTRKQSEVALSDAVREISALRAHLVCYENPHSPPSADSPGGGGPKRRRTARQKSLKGNRAASRATGGAPVRMLQRGARFTG